MAEGKTLEQLLEAALRRLVAANAGLGQIENGQTLYERQPSKSDASLAAWLELNNFIGQAKVACLGGRRCACFPGRGRRHMRRRASRPVRA